MNICLLVYDISLTGGAEKAAANLACEFANNYDTHLLTLFNENNKVIDADINLKQSTLVKETGSISLNFIRYSHRLRRYLADNNIDVLIAITAGVVTLSNIAAVNTRVKVIYAEHSNLENRTYGKKHEFRQWFGAKFSDYVVTLTERDKRNFINKFHLDKDKVVSIPNWYIEKTITNRLYADKSKKIISVGRLEKVKGYNYLLEIAKKIYEFDKTWHWDIYGEGSLHKNLESQICESGLSSFITLKGNVSNIDEIYTEYSFLVMTSLYEGLPMSLLEAQSAGLPVVSFDCPTGPSEIISEGINGRLIPCYDVDKMSSVIIELISDAKLRKKYSQNARMNLYRFDKEKVMNEWKALIMK